MKFHDDKVDLENSDANVSMKMNAVGFDMPEVAEV